jgi:D-tyrosyl-tRNA(Tyr) deacylase
MRALVQRVTEGEVLTSNQSVARIGRGLVILLGITHSDSETEAQWLAAKVANLRIFSDDEGKLNRSLLDIRGSALVVSQFTLYGDVRRGRRPSFVDAARPEQAEPLVTAFADYLASFGINVQTGRFQSEMLVRIYNDGPVTLWLDTAELLKSSSKDN